MAAKELNARFLRLASNPDFILLRKGLAQERMKLFELGDKVDTIERMWELRGQRKNLETFASDKALSDIFDQVV